MSPVTADPCIGSASTGTGSDALFSTGSGASLDRANEETQDHIMNTSHNVPVGAPKTLANGLTLCDDGLVRPTWASHDTLMRLYYDTEWGMPVHDESGVYERLILEGFQSGLSWRTVLAKRAAFREAFANFQPERVAGFGPQDVEALMSNASIIRNRRKIEAAISNARATLAIRSCEADAAARDEQPSHLGDLVWRFCPTHDPRPTCAAQVPTQTHESRALAAELRRRGFRFVGPTTMLALMTAIGIVNTDIIGTYRRPR